MRIVRKFGDDHINKSVRQIDSNSWLIGRKLLLQRSLETLPGVHLYTWTEDDVSVYTLSAVEHPELEITPPDSPYITLVHDVSDESAVWSIGNKVICEARYIYSGVTYE
jgi:hypothetical protein